MRVAFENGTVHERAGVTFVGVTYYVFLACGLSFSESPFLTGGEACAATSADAGIEDGLDNFLGSHGCGNLCESLVAVACDVFVDAFRVDNTAVTESNTLLLCVEGSLVESEDFVALNGFAVKKLTNGVAFYEVFGYDFVHIRSGNLAVECAFGVNDHDRTECAETEAACGDNFDFIFNACELQFLDERVADIHGVRRCATGTAANQNVFADAVARVNNVTVAETHGNCGRIFIFQFFQLFNVGDHIFGFPFLLFYIKDIF